MLFGWRLCPWPASVNISPTVPGVSQNPHRSFNFGATGTTLNGTGINARATVNQVISTNPNLIEGQLGVIGQEYTRQ
ncbi:hypothetical protein [Trinickia terrae]|uniref:hypothetical protein n=1 Tax=Trinickia terrae TaxID=2571161 RepID=UPI001F0FEEC0|nr:hypothetical protein [Trinickia terrae]